VAEAGLGSGGSRLGATRDWLRRRAGSSLGRFALLWMRRYLEASRNSGAAASAYITLSVLPCALVAVGFFDLSGGDENAFAQRLITHLDLDPETAKLVSGTFGTTSSNMLAATVTVVLGFLIWGLSIGQIYQSLYARAWKVDVGSPADQILFTAWFFVLSGLIALMAVSAAELHAEGWLIVLPVWLLGSIAFWLWTPHFLLHGAVSLRALFPGALLGSLVTGGTIATAPLWIGTTIEKNAQAFGSFGVVVGLLAYVLIWVTISMVCAVFAPVWAEWRGREKDGAAS